MTQMQHALQAPQTIFFTHEQRRLLDQARLPKHVAIIPDGNRRWAKMMNDVPSEGHRAGAHVLMDVVRAGRELGVKAVTFYLFSTENWQRSQEEIGALMWLLQEFLLEHCQEMVDTGVRLRTIGAIDSLPPEVVHVVNETIAATADGTDIDMILALNYGGRDEIRRVVQQLCHEVRSEEIDPAEITEELIGKYLDTATISDPDLLIRTSGEMRISNFLLWQLSYTELYVTDVLWPNFTPNDFFDALVDFQRRQRRLGGS
jgi:undecaprenyl diphosphate synthase